MQALYAVILFGVSKIFVLLTVAPVTFWVVRMGAPISHMGRAVLVAALIPLALFAFSWGLMRLHRHKRWPPPCRFVPPPRLGIDRILLVGAMSLVPVAVGVAALNSSFSEPSADLRWAYLPASIWCLAWPAFAEEFFYRRILLGEFLRVADHRISWCVVAIVAQAVIFALLHGKAARISIDHFLHYLLGGAILGWTYWIYQSVWLNAFVHLLMNISVAQVGPTSQWFAGRIAQFAGDQWHGWFAAGAAVLLAVNIATLPLRKAKSRDESRPWHKALNN